MNDQQQCGEEIRPGEHASIENRSDGALSIAITTGSGARISLELAPGQALELEAGELAARVLLQEGEVADLLVVRPGQPS